MSSKLDDHFLSVLNPIGDAGVDKSLPHFLQSDSFKGKKSGYVFKNGSNGVGYYLDGAVVEKSEPVEPLVCLSH